MSRRAEFNSSPCSSCLEHRPRRREAVTLSKQQGKTELPQTLPQRHLLWEMRSKPGSKEEGN